MKRLRALLVALTAIVVLAGLPVAQAQAGPGGASISASSAAKKKCKKFKGAKKRKCLKNAGKGGGQKPWTGSPYKPKMTCAMSPEMQRKYARYGLTCIDLGMGVTTLIEL